MGEGGGEALSLFRFRLSPFPQKRLILRPETCLQVELKHFASGRFFFCFLRQKRARERSFTLGPTTGTGNEKRKTQRKSRAKLLPDRDMDIITGSGARFSKVPIINGPGKLSRLPLKIEVSTVLHLT